MTSHNRTRFNTMTSHNRTQFNTMTSRNRTVECSMFPEKNVIILFQ